MPPQTSRGMQCATPQLVVGWATLLHTLLVALALHQLEAAAIVTDTDGQRLSTEHDVPSAASEARRSQEAVVLGAHGTLTHAATIEALEEQEDLEDIQRVLPQDVDAEEAYKCDRRRRDLCECRRRGISCCDTYRCFYGHFAGGPIKIQMATGACGYYLAVPPGPCRSSPNDPLPAVEIKYFYDLVQPDASAQWFILDYNNATTFKVKHVGHEADGCQDLYLTAHVDAGVGQLVLAPLAMATDWEIAIFERTSYYTIKVHNITVENQDFVCIRNPAECGEHEKLQLARAPHLYRLARADGEAFVR